MSTTRVSLIVLVLAMSLTAASRQRSPAASGAPDVTMKVVAAANAFLATLTQPQRASGTFAFNSPQRTNWSNLPSGIFRRNGLRLGDLTAPQRAAALAVVAAALSTDGYHKVMEIINGDEVLKTEGGGATGGRQGRGGVRFGRDEYYIALLGAPSLTTPWRVQFGGHHLAINVTIAGGQSVMTPSLPAAQPARYVLNGETVRPLGHENDKAFALVNALDANERREAILNYRVDDLVLGPGEDGRTIMPEGLRATAMTPAQQNMLFDLAHEWVGILNAPAANAKMAELRANVSQTWFAWSGPTTNGSPAYFRIQGPTVVIEYAPQQGDVMHVHSIYRDPTNDYGSKLVATR